MVTRLAFIAADSHIDPAVDLETLLADLAEAEGGGHVFVRVGLGLIVALHAFVVLAAAGEQDQRVVQLVVGVGGLAALLLSRGLAPALIADAALPGAAAGAHAAPLGEPIDPLLEPALHVLEAGLAGLFLAVPPLVELALSGTA
jgi:hypothetical protein